MISSNIAKGTTFVSNFAKTPIGSNTINLLITGSVAFAFGKMEQREKIKDLTKIIEVQNLKLLDCDTRDKEHLYNRNNITARENNLINEMRYIDRKSNDCLRELDSCRRDLEKSVLPMRYSLFKKYCHQTNQLEIVSKAKDSPIP